MKTSRDGIALLKKWEGCRLKAYLDPVGIWTIGYGHTSAAGLPKVAAGLIITRQEAEDILVRDLVQYESAVAKALTRSASQPQFDAMVSLCFNIGPGAFAGSTVVRKFNAGDVAGAADAFRLWNKAGGKVLPGLEFRREDERKLFMTTQPKPVERVPAAPAPTPLPAPESPPAATPAPASPAADLAKWVMAAAAGLVAILAAWMMKG